MSRMDQRPEPAAENMVCLVPELRASLEAGLTGIEPRFEVLGRDLETIYANAEELTKGIMISADSMTEGGGDSLLDSVGKVVQDSLSILSGCRETLSGSLANIEAGTGRLAQLCGICEKMKTSSRFLNVVGLNISVEGSRTKETLAMFGSFGEEIKALAGKIDELSSTVNHDSNRVKEDQLAVYRDIGNSLKTFDELSESTRRAVQLATENMSSISRLASRTLETAGNHSRKISAIVGEIVMAIQFHDIARQQVEHVISALKDARTLVKEPSPGPEEVAGADEAQRKGRAFSILVLQAAQLKQVFTEAREVYEKIQDAFGRIGEEVDQLMEKVAASGGDSVDSTDREGKNLDQGVRQFRADLEKLRQILVRGKELEKKIRVTIQGSSKTVSRLSQYTDQVNNINIDLQYKAINAIIMTSKLGEKGATLEVLARSVRDLSNESNTHVGQALDVIRSITELAGMPGRDSLNRREEGDDMASFDAGLEKGIERISTAYENYTQHCSRSGQLAENIVKSIEGTKKDLAFLPEWVLGLTQVQERLETLLQTLEPWKVMARDLPAGTEDEIALRYTMESERRVHRQLSGEADEEAEGDQDLDDNIELF